MENSRTSNSYKTMISGIYMQVFTILLSFLTRTVFIKVLGAEYLGINGLFSNLLSVISLAELGVGTAITFYLYKPIANNDKEKMKSLINFYKIAYTIIGIAILCIGLSVIPFLNRLIKPSSELNINYTLVYFLFLLDPVASYLFYAYKSTIIAANQKTYVLNRINISVSVCKSLILILVLAIFRNYILTLILNILATLIRNILVSIKAGKLYPFINDKSYLKLNWVEIRSIMKDVYSIFIVRISSTLFQSTDNIVISIMIGTIYVGIYSNYLLLIGTIVGILTIIRGSITASVGNINAIESVETKYKMFRNLDFFNFYLSSICAICFYHLLNPFILLWIGKEYVFNQTIVGVIVANFLTVSLLSIVFLFRETLGLFRYGKYRQLVGGILNIFLDIFLARQLGVLGVLLATLFSSLLVTIFPFPKIVYKYGFNKPYKEYIYRYLGYCAFTIISIILVSIPISVISRDDWFGLLFRLFFSLLIPNILYYIMFRKTEEFIWVKGKLNYVANNINESIRLRKAG